MDVVPEPLGEPLDRRRRDGGTTAVEGLDRGEVLRPRILQAHERVIRGDRTDRERDAVLTESIEHDLRPEPAREDERRVADEGERGVGDLSLIHI